MIVSLMCPLCVLYVSLFDDNRAHVDFAEEVDPPVRDESLSAFLCAHYCHYHLQPHMSLF